MNYDYIIVGAGIGGLSAGLNLAFNKKKVLILEKNSLPGGIVTTIKKGRFEFDTSLYDLLDYGSEEHIGSLQRIFKKFGLDIDTISIPYNIRIKSLDEKFDEVMKGDIDDWILRLEELYSGSMSTFRSLLPVLKEIDEALNLLKKGKKDSLKDFPNFIKYLDKNAYEALVDLNLPTETIHVLGYLWIEIGSPLNKLSFIDFAEFMYKYIFKRPVALANKNIDFTLKLVNRFQELGGKIYYRSWVKEIRNLGEKQEVVLEDGTSYQAKEVICNLPERYVIKNLIKEDYPFLNQKENARTLSMNGLVVYLGLNKSYQDLKLYNYRYYEFQNLNSMINMKSMKEFYHHTIEAIVPNIVNEKASPKNTTILVLKTLYNDAPWNKINASNYYQIKNDLAKGLIEEFELAFNIDIKEYIEEMVVATPFTFKKFTNRSNGSIFGPMRLGYDNSINRLISYKEEGIPHLSFVGEASIFGGGLDNAIYSGYYITEQLLKEERRND